ncbi:MAG: stage III sporulation protein AC [Ruminococcaceae bacterium]|nr:stage III sporulation protein AC [Oscillospiraceae bacterium]
MDVAFILKIAGIGLVVSVACQILSKSGRDEQATFVSIAGIIVVLVMLVSELKELFSLIRSVFGLS